MFKSLGFKVWCRSRKNDRYQGSRLRLKLWYRARHIDLTILSEINLGPCSWRLVLGDVG